MKSVPWALLRILIKQPQQITHHEQQQDHHQQEQAQRYEQERDVVIHR